VFWFFFFVFCFFSVAVKGSLYPEKEEEKTPPQKKQKNKKKLSPERRAHKGPFNEQIPLGNNGERQGTHMFHYRTGERGFPL
jgi:hypothetical protein